MAAPQSSPSPAALAVPARQTARPVTTTGLQPVLTAHGENPLAIANGHGTTSGDRSNKAVTPSPHNPLVAEVMGVPSDDRDAAGAEHDVVDVLRLGR